MTDLIPVTALGDVAPRGERLGTLTISENAGLGLASLALRKGQVAPAPFGLVLPGVAQAIQTGAHGAFWTGPNQWMIEGEGRAETDFAAALAGVAPGCSVTEQTDGFVTFEITSDAGAAPIEALLVKLVNIDPQMLGPGRTTRTGLHHMTVFLIRRAEDRLAVIGMRTLAGSLWHALSDTARRTMN